MAWTMDLSSFKIGPWTAATFRRQHLDHLSILGRKLGLRAMSPNNVMFGPHESPGSFRKDGFDYWQ